MIDWTPLSKIINWAPLSVAPRAEGEATPTFPLLIHCHTAVEREQIAAELTKHGIKCDAVAK